MTASETLVKIDDYRRRLLELEQKLTGRVGVEVETARGVTDDDQLDAGDLARNDELKDEYLTLAQTDSTTLGQVRAALRRIDEGTYGKCIVDGEPIDPRR